MDSLKIYEGIDESGLLTDARRWAINYPYLSTGNNLALVFTTDSTGTSNGFKIRYTTLPGEIMHASYTDVQKVGRPIKKCYNCIAYF